MSDTTTTIPAPIGSPADRALDAATKGKTGTVRRGFHQAYTTTRGVTANGTPSAVSTVERCTCSERYSHAVVAR